MSREAMQMALEALDSDNPDIQLRAAIALRQALETEQEPVAWLSTDCIGERYLCFTKPKDNDPVQPLYTTPPKREWVGLTAYEIQEIHSGNQHWGSFACAIEQALKEKNT